MKIKKFLIRSIVVVFIMIIFWVLYDMIHPKMKVVATDGYFISSGETLWSISKKHAPKGVDVWDYMKLIQKHNINLTSDIKPGEEINLPVVEVR